MSRTWHMLALLSVSAFNFGGCFLAHSPGDPPSDPPPETPCGCAADELCVEACWGDRRCVPRPEGPICEASDPCRDLPSYGFCGGVGAVDGILHCACPSDPPPLPTDTPCGAEICAADELCVEACDAESPLCVERGDTFCEGRCDCFAEDPCGRLGPRSVCADVVETEVGDRAICACAGPAPTCEDVLRGASAGACDPAAFGECTRPVDGIPCCWRSVFCDAGAVVEAIVCDDSCAQGCSLIEDPGDCRAYGCEHFVSDACVDEPEPGWILGPVCIGPRTTRCEDDADCASGERCRGFPYDPCAGAPCEACLAVERWCTRAP